MGSREKGRGKVGTSVAMLMVGLLMGSVMLSPVGAHIKNFNHLKAKHFYTKKASNNRFINVGEKASDADKLDGKDSTEFLGTAGKAADADKLDNLDSTAFQRSGCVDGNVLGYVRIVAADYGSGYTNVPTSFTCVSGFTSRAKQTSPGVFRIDFGFNGTILLSPCGQHVPVATLEDLGDIIASSGSEGGPIASDCVVDVNTFDDLGDPAGVDFSLVIHRNA
jgi:hypothetical protein